LLLPVFDSGVSEWYWGLVSEYVKAFRPTCGFEAAEAQLAHYVTIVGNPRGVSKEVETNLRQAGCLVERIAGRDGAETQAILHGLAQRSQRFLTLESSSPKHAPNTGTSVAQQKPAQEWLW